MTASGRVGVPFSSVPGAEFVGEVNSFDFKIMPVIKYRNAFLPVIKGRITVDGNISVLHIKMRLSLGVRIILAGWFAGAGYDLFLLISGVSSSLTEEERFFLFAAIVFFGLSQFAFYSPAKQAAQRLKELLT